MAFTPNLIQIDQIQSPQDLFNFSRDELILGVKKSKHPFHLCTFCTVIDGCPSARTVVSRGVNECLTQCRIHSDQRSQKNKHILESPNVALLFYSQSQKLQVRFEGHAHIMANKVDEDYFFDTSSPNSQLCYAFPTPPGTVIEDKTKERVYPQISIHELDTYRNNARNNFSAIVITIHSMDALWLSKSEHIRIHGQHIENEWDLKFIIA